MLTLKFREPELAHPLQAICPWIDHITPELVLNKDGSLLAAYEFRGLDPDNLYSELVDSVTDQLQQAYNLFDNRITAWWIVDKRRDTTYPANDFQNPTAEKIDRIYSQRFTSGHHYSITYTLYLLYTGATGTDKFFDRVSRIQAETEAPLGKALIDAFRESLSMRNAFARDIGALRENIATFERLLTSFVNSSPLNCRRLVGDDFDAALGTLLNRASPPVTHRKPQGAMLDAWLPTNYVATGPDVIQFKGNDRTVYAAALGVVKWPETTSPMLFESLAVLDMELTICQIVRFLDATQSALEIDKAIEYYNLTKFGLLTHAIAKAAGQEPEAKAGKATLQEDCKDAQHRIGAEGVTYAYHNLTVFLYGADQRELNRNVSAASQRLSGQRFAMIRERQNTMPSFAAMLPGQWSQQSRYELLSIENVADCSPLYTMDEGSRHHEFFSEDVYRRPVPKFSVFGNTYGGRFNFAPHVGQVGHMVIIAPTGGGKTTFVNFCLSQFQRYGDVRTFIFDRNSSCKIVTELHGGQHVDIKAGNVRLNPFFAMQDGSPDGLVWVREFVLRRLSEGGYIATTEDRKAIDTTLATLQASNQPLSMSVFAALLPKHLEAQLGEWLAGRPYGMFDCVEDDFSVSKWTTVEMRDILSVERLSRAFLDYAFRKIYVSLTGEPTFIYLEEASFLINDPKYADLIDEWLKTFRKKNAFIWLTLQSPTSITNSSMSASILDNIFSFLLLKNTRVEAHREAYKRNFALQDHQVDMIATLKPKREYLLVQDDKTRVLTTEFTPEVLAYLRSEEHVLNKYHKFKAAGGDDWKERYIESLLHDH